MTAFIKGCAPWVAAVGVGHSALWLSRMASEVMANASTPARPMKIRFFVVMGFLLVGFGPTMKAPVPRKRAHATGDGPWPASDDRCGRTEVGGARRWGNLRASASIRIYS